MSLVWLTSVWMTRRSQKRIDPQIPQTWCSYGSTVGYQWNHKWLVVEAVNHPILEAKTWTMMTPFMKITPTQLKSQIRAGHLLSSQIRLLLCAWEDLLIPSAKESARNIVISYHLYITLSQFISSCISISGPIYGEGCHFYLRSDQVDSTLRSHVWSLKMVSLKISGKVFDGARYANDTPTTKNWIQSTSCISSSLLQPLFARY